MVFLIVIKGPAVPYCNVGCRQYRVLVTLGVICPALVALLPQMVVYMFSIFFACMRVYAVE